MVSSWDSLVGGEVVLWEAGRLSRAGHEGGRERDSARTGHKQSHMHDCIPSLSTKGPGARSNGGCLLCG